MLHYFLEGMSLASFSSVSFVIVFVVAFVCISNLLLARHDEFMNIAKWHPGVVSATHSQSSDTLRRIDLHDCASEKLEGISIPVGKNFVINLPVTDASQ